MVPLVLDEGRWPQRYHHTVPSPFYTDEQASILYGSLTSSTASTTTTNVTTTSATITATPLPAAPYRSTWGARRDPLYIVVPMTIIYAIIFLTGVIGNVSTCIVIARNKSMHTATNYYLFSLAVSDLLLLVSGLPPEMYYIWSHFPYVFGEVFCVIQGFAAETSANATVLTITAFTVERYVAICHPFLSHTMSKLTRAIKFVIAIWLVALCLAIPQAMSFGIVYETSADGRIPYEDHYVCIVKRVVIPHAFEISTFLFFVAPMTLITVLYVLIALQLRRSSVIGGEATATSSVSLKTGGIFKRKERSGGTEVVAAMVPPHSCSPQNVDASQSDDGRKNCSRNVQTNATKRVVKMLVAVVVAFFICWAPFHAQRLLAIYGTHSAPHMVAVFTVLTYVSGVLYYLSTTINPLLYHIMSNKFREAFKETLSGYCGRGRRGRRRRRTTAGTGGVGRCYSVLSGRLSHNNSTSGCSIMADGAGGSGRYIESEVASLREYRRPLVVSFRRREDSLSPKFHRTSQSKHSRQTRKADASPPETETVSDDLGSTGSARAILDAELQEALANLADESKSRARIGSWRHPAYRLGEGGRTGNNVSLHVLSRESAALDSELSSESALLDTDLREPSVDDPISEPIDQGAREYGRPRASKTGELATVFSKGDTRDPYTDPTVEDITLFQNASPLRLHVERDRSIDWCPERLPTLEDIEIFQEQRFVMRAVKRSAKYLSHGQHSDAIISPYREHSSASSPSHLTSLLPFSNSPDICVASQQTVCRMSSPY